MLNALFSDKTINYEQELKDLNLLDDRLIWFGGFTNQSRTSARRNNLFLMLIFKRKSRLISVKDDCLYLITFSKKAKVNRKVMLSNVDRVFKRRGSRLVRFVHIKVKDQRNIKVTLNFNKEKYEDFLKIVEKK